MSHNVGFVARRIGWLIWPHAVARPWLILEFHMPASSDSRTRFAGDRLRLIAGKLAALGYDEDLIVEDYDFAVLTAETEVRTAPLAAFAEFPPDYQNACIGVTTADEATEGSRVAPLYFLGAPIVFSVSAESLSLWRFTASGTPEQVKRFPWADVDAAFAQHSDEWRPARILGAKAGGPLQLDFVDVGLMPALEGQIHQKLDALLKTAIYDIGDVYSRVLGSQPDQRDLFRLMFRLIAAKVLRDRGAEGGWQAEDPAAILRAVDEHYHSATDGFPSAGIQHPDVLTGAWSAITDRFHFPNLSVDDLVRIYEDTFVTQDTRRVWGTHSTPPRLAEYIVRKLPLEAVPVDRRRVLEPCSGHGVFLVSVMRRLREDWAADTGGISRSEYLVQRHGYLRERLIGIERDDFAREVCRLNLMLADFPNPNGWQLFDDDVFQTARLDEEAARSTIVLCNPPFEPFTDEESQRYGPLVSRGTKAAEVLYRVLKSPPELLGFVLPRDFISGGATYREAHRLLAQSYSHVELVALPDKAFEHADMETVLLMASGREEQHSNTTVICRRVHGHEYRSFYDRGAEPVGVEVTVPVARKLPKDFSLWTAPELPALWRYLQGHRTLSTIADVKRGIQWKPGVDEDSVVSDEPHEGWWAGYKSPRDSLAPYALAPPTKYLNPEPDNMVGYPMKRDWDEPKVLLNAQAGSRGPWRLFAAVDYDAVLVTQAFHVAWPRSETTPVQVIAAIINGPVANAWVCQKDDKRHNKVGTCRRIPIPDMNRLDQDMVVRKADRLQAIHALRGWQDASRNSEFQRLLHEVDALILEAYDLPGDMADGLFSLFTGAGRRKIVTNDYGKRHMEAKESLLREYAQDRRIERYQELITRKYVVGLEAAEAAEVARLEAEMDEYDAPFYEAMLSRMRERGAPSEVTH